MTDTTAKDKSIIWSKRVRIFHWVNALSVLSLIAVGTIISGETSEIGIFFSEEVRESLIPYHIGIGVVLAINFLFRVQALIKPKNHGESFKEINPLAEDNIDQLMDSKPDSSYKYHNPIGRIMIFSWFIVIFAQIVTGSLLAVEHISEDYELSASLISEARAHESEHIKPDLSKDAIEKNNSIEEHEENIIMEIHEYINYAIILMLFLHLAGVLKESVRTKTNLVSRMIRGS